MSASPELDVAPPGPTGSSAPAGLAPTSPAEALARALTWIWPALLVLAFAPTAGWLWERWTLSVWYNGHGLFMPFIVAYLVWEDLRDDPNREAAASPWGFLFLVSGLGLLVLDSAIRSQLLAAIGLVVCLPGLSLLLLGSTRTRRLAFPLIIAAFMLPIPAGFLSSVYLGLREITAWGTAHIVPLLGIPILRDGTMLLTPRSPVQVADACSGFSTLYAAVTTALILSHLSPSWRRRVALLASSVVLALACNIVRVTILVLIIHLWGVEPLETKLHEGSGVATFLVVIAALFAIAGRETLTGKRSA